MLSERVKAIISELEREVAEIQQATCPMLVGELERLRVVAWSKVMCPSVPQASQQSAGTPERYLTVPEVVDRFSVTPKWLYRNKARMPHSQPSRKVLLFPEQAVTKWFTSRKRT